MKPARPKPCKVPDCKARAGWQFLALVDEHQALRVTDEKNKRVRVCQAHLDQMTRKLAALTPYRIRCVPLDASSAFVASPATQR
jgi:hypothetical protein